MITRFINLFTNELNSLPILLLFIVILRIIDKWINKKKDIPFKYTQSMILMFIEIVAVILSILPVAHILNFTQDAIFHINLALGYVTFIVLLLGAGGFMYCLYKDVRQRYNT